MSKEKQIEEMAKILCGMKNGCDGCMWDKVHCNERNYAVEIYNAGYRKQNEGEWVIVEYEYVTCSKCGHYHWSGCDSTAEAKERLAKGDVPNFCPNCGAKMKGGAE